jgi:hypothetical protein
MRTRLSCRFLVAWLVRALVFGGVGARSSSMQGKSPGKINTLSEGMSRLTVALTAARSHAKRLIPSGRHTLNIDSQHIVLRTLARSLFYSVAPQSQPAFVLAGVEHVCVKWHHATGAGK